MKLLDLLEGIEIVEILGRKDIEINTISYNSRTYSNEDMFLCEIGLAFDGHQFAKEIGEKGAKVILVNEESNYEKVNNVTYVVAKNSKKAIAQIAATFYGNPAKQLKLIGVTGTKGKTTTTYMIKDIFESAGKKVGLMGSIFNIYGDCKEEAKNTTLVPVELHKTFKKMVDSGIEYVVMEVASHALDLYRVYGLNFEAAAFTNLSQDHFDYHLNFENYYNAKKKLFSQTNFSITNIDDTYGSRLSNEVTTPKMTVGIYNEDADIRATIIEKHSDSVDFKIDDVYGTHEIKVGIPGLFSVYNSLIAYSIARYFKIDLEYIKSSLEKVVVPGRLEIVPTNKDYTIMIDYAHTPASLENILTTVKEFTKGRVISLFSCCGLRDKLKRPIMGRISGEIADLSIITSDSPRTEKPEDILHDIEVGIKETTGKYVVIQDRSEAIKYAMEYAQKDDIIILACKGHENYVIWGTEKSHYDEREVIQDILNGKI